MIGCALSSPRIASDAAVEHAVGDGLAEMVARPRDVEVEPLHEDTTLRTLAQRLRDETAELDRLRATDADEAER